MTNNPEEIRTNIERTQTELGRDVDALAEKVHPAKAAERQKDRLRDKIRNVREIVMGTPEPADYRGNNSGTLQHAGQRAQDLAHQASDQLSDLGEQAGETVQNIPEKVTSGTRGNPLAAGLIAFGAGLLTASLIPSSRMEQNAAEQVKHQAKPMVDEAKTAAQQAGQRLKPEAQKAAQSVKETASQGAEHVKDDSQDHAQDLKDNSQRAARHVKNTANEA